MHVSRQADSVVYLCSWTVYARNLGGGGGEGVALFSA